MVKIPQKMTKNPLVFLALYLFQLDGRKNAS